MKWLKLYEMNCLSARATLGTSKLRGRAIKMGVRLCYKWARPMKWRARMR